MPRDIQTYTVCAGPDDVRSWKNIGGLGGLIATLFFANPWITSAAFLAILIGIIVINNIYAWAALVMALIMGLGDFEDWYYNGRLLCIRDRDCAIGTVISEPTMNFDGDRKLNLMLAPFSRCEWITTLFTHVAANQMMLTDDTNFNDPPYYTSHPDLPALDQMNVDFDALRSYIRALKSKNPDLFPAESEATPNMFRQVLVGAVDRLLKQDPSKSFYERYFRKDSTVIPEGSATWNAIPEDFDATVNWEDPNAQSTKTHYDPYIEETQTLNPMFRLDLDDLVGFLHGEIEGYRIHLLVEDIILGLLAFLVLVAILTSFLGPIGILLAFLLAIMLIVLKGLIDDATGNNGDAGTPDVTPDEPGFPDGIPQRKGDVIVMYGNFIMDTDHYEYFEIHPIRAYYLLYHDASLTINSPLAPGQCEKTVAVDENLLQGYVNQDFADNVCNIISKAEEGDTPVVLERRASVLLSYGMTTKFAGGGAQRPA